MKINQAKIDYTNRSRNQDASTVDWYEKNAVYVLAGSPGAYFISIEHPDYLPVELDNIEVAGSSKGSNEPYNITQSIVLEMVPKSDSLLGFNYKIKESRASPVCIP